jgi:hypothetical protein
MGSQRVAATAEPDLDSVMEERFAGRALANPGALQDLDRSAREEAGRCASRRPAGSAPTMPTCVRCAAMAQTRSMITAIPWPTPMHIVQSA